MEHNITRGLSKAKGGLIRGIDAVCENVASLAPTFCAFCVENKLSRGRYGWRKDTKAKCTSIQDRNPITSSVWNPISPRRRAKGRNET
jgi:hypothetical protein